MNKELEKMKHEYLQLNASEALKVRIKNTLQEGGVVDMERDNHKRGGSKLGIISGFVAMLCIVMILALNLSPALAAQIGDIPGAEGIVRVLTFGKYNVKDGGFQAEIEAPKIEGLLDQELQDKLNQDFQDNANALIIAFESDMKELKKQFPDQNINLGINSGYILKTDNEDILAIDVYMLNTVGSSSTTHKFYTIDKKNKALLTLKGLFKEDSDYVTVLSEYIKVQMRKLNASGEAAYWVDDPTFGPFEGIKGNQNFYINNEGQVVICFDKYEVAPGYVGSPEFVIPQEIITDILK